MPAVPALIMAGGSVVSSVVSAKAQKNAQKAAAQRSPEELAYMNSQTQLGDQFRRQGSQLFGTAMPQLQSTIDYYRTLLDGSRAARMNAVSGEAQDTAAAYAGADAAADKNLTGGEREQAKAENARARAGQIARLVTGVRPQAAEALGSLGTNLVGQAGNFEGTAANIGANLLDNSTTNRQGAYAEGAAAGQRTSENLGKLFGGIATAAGGIKFGGGPKMLAPPLQGGANLAGNLRGVGELEPPVLAR